MSKNKLVLIIDGNWLLMSRLSVIMNQYKNNYDKLRPTLKLLMIQSIKLVLKQFNDIDNIMFVSDGGSWRTNIDVPQFMKDANENNVPEFENIKYKGTRERQPDIDWDTIFDIYNEFIEELKRYNINVYREKEIEGDDWCAYLSSMLNSQNTNCIIWSKDKDLQQLVNINKDKCFTIWWNKENGVYIKNYNEENLDFLMNNGFTNNEIILNHIYNNVISINKIEPSSVVIDKIIRGDLSDNILPIILRIPKSKDSTRKYRCSVKDIDFELNYNDDNSVYEYLNNLCNSKKYKNKTLGSVDNIFEHFKYNRKLVVLNKTEYPDSILSIFDNYKDYIYVDNIKNIINDIESKYFAEKNQLSSILNII